MATETKIKLRSKYLGHKVELEKPVMQYLPNGGHVITQPAKTIRFQGGVAEVDAETFEMLKHHHSFTGGPNGPRTIWLEEDPSGPAQNRGVRVIDGAMSAGSTAKATAPTPDWDTETPANLRKMIAAGQINPQTAMEYEMSNGRRALVMSALVSAIASTEQQEDGSSEDAPKPRRVRQPKAEEQLEDVAVPLPDDGKVT